MRITAEAKTATSRRILEAAVELFKNKGFEATTTRDIAQASQIATGTLFNYFDTKEAIVAALAEEAYGQAHEALRESTSRGTSLEEDLFSLVAAELRQLKRLRKYIAPLLETVLSPLAAGSRRASDGDLRSDHLALVDELAHRHGFGELSATALHLYWALYTGVLAYWAADKSPKQEDTLALVDQSLTMFVGWLRGGKRVTLQEVTLTRSFTMPTLPELLEALPKEEETAADCPALSELVSQLSMRPVPVGRFSRFTALGTLQAKIGAAYLYHWLRGWFKSAEQNQKLLAETHWRTSLRVLDSMSYLRGVVMKIGQTLANFPDIAPREFVETLQRLHFDAPPMHWSLLKEMVQNELGGDPENLFAEFDTRAFAAASLGQVHRARLKSGEEVAVKIQYPGIARTIRDDFRNLFTFMLPARLNKDWASTKDQFDDLRRRLDQETDYEQEATNLEQARKLFHYEDGIVVPRVYREFSTPRVLTMELLRGRHLSEYIADGPSQEERNEVARKIIVAWYRLMYKGRMFYVDLHPGNYLSLEDGRLGLLDFGLIMPLVGEEWELFRKLDRPVTTGRHDDRIAVLKEWTGIADHETDRLRLMDEYADWCWRGRYCGGEFDFGDEADFRRGIDLFTEMVRKRYSRARPNTPSIARCQFAMRSILYQLRAKIDYRPLAEEEVKATGWDRSDYAST